MWEPHWLRRADKASRSGRDPNGDVSRWGTHAMAPARHRTVRAAASPCFSFLLRSFQKGLIWDCAILRILGIQIDRDRDFTDGYATASVATNRSEPYGTRPLAPIFNKHPQPYVTRSIGDYKLAPIKTPKCYDIPRLTYFVRSVNTYFDKSRNSFSQKTRAGCPHPALVAQPCLCPAFRSCKRGRRRPRNRRSLSRRTGRNQCGWACLSGWYSRGSVEWSACRK